MKRTPLELNKLVKEEAIRAAYKRRDAGRPRISTSLGYDVDGGRTDLDNFRIGKERQYPNIVDADGVPHPVTDFADYDVVINAIIDHGISLKTEKWGKLATLAACTTVEEVEAIIP